MTEGRPPERSVGAARVLLLVAALVAFVLLADRVVAVLGALGV